MAAVRNFYLARFVRTASEQPKLAVSTQETNQKQTYATFQFHTAAMVKTQIFSDVTFLQLQF